MAGSSKTNDATDATVATGVSPSTSSATSVNIGVDGCQHVVQHVEKGQTNFKLSWNLPTWFEKEKLCKIGLMSKSDSVKDLLKAGNPLILFFWMGPFNNYRIKSRLKNCKRVL